MTSGTPRLLAVEQEEQIRKKIDMQTDDFEHLTHRERREVLRWRAWVAKIVLDQAVEARRRAVGNYRMGKAATPEDWAGLQQAVGIESKARQKYNDALAEYNSASPSPGSERKDVRLLTLL